MDKKVIDYALMGTMIFILALGGIATYNQIEYAKELRSGPCILCENMGYRCVAPYQPNITLYLPEGFLNGTKI